jgi:serine/threonine protein kinase
MPVALEIFVKQLEDSGILDGDTLKDFIPPKATPKDGEQLARELVRLKKLTKFQAEEVWRGNGKSLVLGNYVLMEKIGAGGMGQVFKAHHRRMDRFVAVKVLPVSTMKNPATIARFEREVKAAAKISHTNIVAAYDADCANGVPFLVMELVEGSDLSALVKKNGPFSVEKVVHYILQAARGLEAAHKKGIVHRDIKPANLLLDKEGTVKILDMGLARLGCESDCVPQAELTSTGTVMGTVDYMAPEQAVDSKTADARADIYALGCSLFYLLIGKSTYEGDSLMNRMLAHREKPIPSLRAIRSEVPEQLDSIFKRMVAKNVEDRFQTMSDVIADLQRLELGRATVVVIPQLETTIIHSSDTQSLAETEAALTSQAIAATLRPVTAAGKGNKVFIYRAVSAAFIGVLLLAAITISIRTREGNLIVEVDQPNSPVQVWDEAGKVEISQKGVGGKVTISVDPGKQRLKVEKDGITTFGQEFEMVKNGKKEITAKLEPLEVKPEMVGTKPVPVVGEKRPLAFQTPEFEKWMKDVAAMPAETQVEAVRKKLMELNLGFNGDMTPTISEAGVRLMVVTDHIFDISPVKALRGLNDLYCSSNVGHTSKFSDLSPLQGLKLELLNISGTKVRDLSPLKKMPLRYLTFHDTPISDLSPLEGMQLNFVGGNGSRVSDITLLKGMPLKSVEFGNSQVTDLSPLKGIPLTGFFCFNTGVTDLSPLKGMPIENLHAKGCRVTEFSLLQKMPLRFLTIDFKPFRDTELLRSVKTLEQINEKPVAEFWKDEEVRKASFEQWMKEVAALPAEQQVQSVSKKLIELNPGFDGAVTPTIEDSKITAFQFFTDNVTDISPVRALAGVPQLSLIGSSLRKGKLVDISPLQGMRLTSLILQFNEVGNLTPLKGMPLTTLNLYGWGQVKDLTPLQDMPLSYLDLAGQPIRDLEPLKGMLLTFLNLENTQVSDLTPLQDMPLTRLSLLNLQVRNLEPLKDMPLNYLDLRNTQVQDLKSLKGMPLTVLWLGDTQVRDLEPLKGMKLNSLGLPNTQVQDLNLLNGMPLRQLYLDFKPERDTELLRSIRTLETINDTPAAEFWKGVEQKQKGNKP